MALPPIVDHGDDATEVMSISAQVNANLTSTGGQTTEVIFYWGASDGMTNKVDWANATSLGLTNVIGPVSQRITNLTPGQTYFYRAYATNSDGFAWANATASFMTAMSAGPSNVVLGETAHFTLLAGSAITTTGGGTVQGDVGLSPAAGSFIALTQAQVDGVIYAVDASGPAGSVVDPTMLTQAKGDLTVAYNDARDRTPVPTGPFLNPGGGNIGGLTLVPGLYKFTSQALITGSDVTLYGGPDDVWIFQIATEMIVGADGRSVILSGGAQARNVYWQVGSSATLGTFSNVKGTIMADQSIVIDTSAILEGRALARIGQITFNGLSANLPQDADPVGPEITLTIESAHGMATPPVGTYTNLTGTVLTNWISGTETLGGTQFVPSGWTLTGQDPTSGLSTNMIMTHTNNATLTWLWTTNFLLNATAASNGTILGDTNGFYASGSTVSVTASPNPGYQFAGWSGQVTGPTNSAVQILTMDQARTLVANFNLSSGPGTDCGTVITTGAIMERNVTGLFAGSGLTFSAQSSAPGVMSVTISPNGLLRLVALSMGDAVITVSASSSGPLQVQAFEISVLGNPAVISNTFPAHEPWNPRFEQRLVLRNDSGCDAVGVRLLFSNIRPGITLENQTGFAPAPDGRPMIEFSTDFPNGGQLDLSVIYLSSGAFRPDQYPPTIEVQFILPNAQPVPPGLGNPVTVVKLVPLGNDRTLLEFASVPGQSYRIRYMNEFPAGPWEYIPLVLTAGANRTQWIDYGPPATRPPSGARVYQVMQVFP